VAHATSHDAGPALQALDAFVGAESLSALITTVFARCGFFSATLVAERSVEHELDAVTLEIFDLEFASTLFTATAGLHFVLQLRKRLRAAPTLHARRAVLTFAYSVDQPSKVFQALRG